METLIKLSEPEVVATSGNFRVVIYKEAPYVNIIQERIFWRWWATVLSFTNPHTKTEKVDEIAKLLVSSSAQSHA